MFCILGSDGYFKKINPFWTTVLGWSEEELLGKPFIEYLHPEDLEPTLSIRKRLIEENTIVPFENRYLCKDGTYRWLSWKYFLNPEGQAIFGVARDVTLNKEVQKSLKESKERFRGIFENNHAVMLIIDPENGNLIDANPAARKYYGYSAEEFSKMNISQINLMSREAVRQEMRSAKKNKKTFFNFQHRLAQGEIRDVEVYSGPVRFKQKDFLYSIVHDVTDRKAAEEALRQNEAFSRTIIQTLPDGMVIVKPEGTIQKIAEKTVRNWGYSSEQELIGRNILEFIDPSYHFKTRQLIAEIVQGRLPDPSEYLVRRKDGSSFYVEANADLIRDAKGNPSGILFIDRDITRRKKLEEEVLHQNNFQRIVAKLSIDFIHTRPENIDEKINKFILYCGRLMGFDRAYVLQPSEEDSLLQCNYEWCEKGIEAVEPIHQPIQEASQPWVKELILSGEEIVVPDVEALPEQPRGLRQRLQNRKVLSAVFFPMVRDQIFLGCLGLEATKEKKNFGKEILDQCYILTSILSDALEKNRLDLALEKRTRELAESNATKDKLFSIIAHDLRSPFNAFLGLTGLMVEEENDMEPAQVKQYAKALHKMALQNFRLLENLLEWSRLQRGLIEPDFSTVRLKDFLEESTEGLKDNFSEKNIHFHLHVPPEVQIRLDKNMLDTVLRNLLSNALKYTPSGGSVELSAESIGSRKIRIRITDTGIGIPASMLPHLFTVNENKSRPGLNGEKSTGLGLILCKEFVELHKGHIRAESKEGRGSTFYIELPVTE